MNPEWTKNKLSSASANKLAELENLKELKEGAVPLNSSEAFSLLSFRKCGDVVVKIIDENALIPASLSKSDTISFGEAMASVFQKQIEIRLLEKFAICAAVNVMPLKAQALLQAHSLNLYIPLEPYFRVNDMAGIMREHEKLECAQSALQSCRKEFRSGKISLLRYEDDKEFTLDEICYLAIKDFNVLDYDDIAIEPISEHIKFQRTSVDGEIANFTFGMPKFEQSILFPTDFGNDLYKRAERAMTLNSFETQRTLGAAYLEQITAEKPELLSNPQELILTAIAETSACIARNRLTIGKYERILGSNEQTGATQHLLEKSQENLKEAEFYHKAITRNKSYFIRYLTS